MKMEIQFDHKDLMPGGKFRADVEMKNIGWNNDGSRTVHFFGSWRALTKGESEKEWRARNEKNNHDILPVRPLICVISFSIRNEFEGIVHRWSEKTFRCAAERLFDVDRDGSLELLHAFVKEELEKSCGRGKIGTIKVMCHRQAPVQDSCIGFSEG